MNVTAPIDIVSMLRKRDLEYGLKKPIMWYVHKLNMCEVTSDIKKTRRLRCGVHTGDCCRAPVLRNGSGDGVLLAGQGSGCSLRCAGPDVAATAMSTMRAF